MSETDQVTALNLPPLSPLPEKTKNILISAKKNWEWSRMFWLLMRLTSTN